MKKAVYILLSVISVLLIAYLIRYKLGDCICDTIPSNAKAVVKVDVRLLEQHFVQSYMMRQLSPSSDKEDKPKDPKKASDKPSKKDSISQPRLTEFIKWPKSFLLYRIGEKWNWKSSPLSVKDTTSLIAYLNHNDYNENGDGIYSNDNKHVVLRDKKISVVIGDLSVIETSEDKSAYLASGNPLFDSIDNSNSEASYVDALGNNLDFTFDKGSIQLSGNYNLDFLESSTSSPTGDNVGHLSMQLNLENLLKDLDNNYQDKFSNFTKLKVDSLAHFMNGEIQANFHDLMVKVDTIVTYDYDDDFNKVEIKKVEKNLQPSYSMSIGLSPEGEQYMRRQKAIVSQDGQDILAIMPLVKTFCDYDSTNLYLYTDNHRIELEDSNSKLELSFNAGMSNAKGWGKRMKEVNDVSITISSENDIRGVINLSDDVCPIGVMMK